MGKDFGRELSKLQPVTQAASSADVTDIQKYLQKYHNLAFRAVGSGGSFTVAKVFEYFCLKAGWLAIAGAPLGLRDIPDQIRRDAVVLFSASGRNNDIKNAYRFLCMTEPQGILSLCMKMDSPLKALQRDNLHNYYYEYQMPVKKDGYLAVESLISSILLLAKAFRSTTNQSFYCFDPEHKWGKKLYNTELLQDVLEKETVIVLHSGITTPGAIDLESKFSETALGNTQLVDYRSFAHGRHYWLSSRKEKTGIIAFYGKSDAELAERTLTLIPNSIPQVGICVQDNTIEGMLDTFDAVFQIVEDAGRVSQINPGKPHVEEFGRKLYHLNYDIYKNSRLYEINKNKALTSAWRKVGFCSEVLRDKYRTSADEQLKAYRTKGFKGIVFDYDGTLHNKNVLTQTETLIRRRLNELLEQGLLIGIATGRGKSVRNEMREWICSEFWRNVAVAYYNGGVIGCLDDESQPNKKKPAPKPFEVLRNKILAIDKNLMYCIDGFEDGNPYQLTFIENGNENYYLTRQSLLALLEGIEGLSVLESDHSIDIVPKSSSKNNIFHAYQERGLENEHFLKIGDSGNRKGNDYVLLRNPFSLSVDTVSEEVDSCWNFAPLGMRNLEATIYYLSKLKKQVDGTFVLELDTK